jgi:hypothetical protein
MRIAIISDIYGSLTALGQKSPGFRRGKLVLKSSANIRR